jgi:tRNA(Ile)-lysidine synthase
VKALGIQPFQDMTNFDPVYLRNRLRHEVIPYLEKIQPGLRPSLLRLARITQEELAVLKPLEEASWQACFRNLGDNYIVLNAPALRNQPVGLLRRIFRRALAVLRSGLVDIDFNAVERMVAFIQSPAHAGQADVISGLRLLLEGDDLWLASWDADLPTNSWPQLPGSQSCLPVQVPGRINLPDGWYLSANMVEDAELALRLSVGNTDPFQAWLDFDRCGPNLVLMRRWEGARFQPLGLNGQTQKVSDRMIDAHLPSRARGLWPLLCCQDQILWIPGLAVAHPARLTDQTRQVMHLIVSRSDSS